MSTVCIIEKDGVIVEERYAYASYRDPKGRGETVKPATEEELKALRERSERAKQIRELKKKLEEDGPSGKDGAAQRERERLIAKLMQEEKEQEKDTAVLLPLLLERRQKLYQMKLAVNAEGTDAITGEELDQLTWGSLSEIEKRLQEIDAADSATAAETLTEIDEELCLLEETSVRNMLQQRERFFTLNLIWRTLSGAGWQVRIMKKGSFGEQIILETSKGADNKALIVMESEERPEITLMTETCRPQARKDLEQMILGAIQDNGSPFAKSRCTNPVNNFTGLSAKQPYPEKEEGQMEVQSRKICCERSSQ